MAIKYFKFCRYFGEHCYSICNWKDQYQNIFLKENLPQHHTTLQIAKQIFCNYFLFLKISNHIHLNIFLLPKRNELISVWFGNFVILIIVVCIVIFVVFFITSNAQFACRFLFCMLVFCSLLYIKKHNENKKPCHWHLRLHRQLSLSLFLKHTLFLHINMIAKILFFTGPRQA